MNNHIELVRSQIAECYHELDRLTKEVTVEAVKIGIWEMDNVRTHSSTWWSITIVILKRHYRPVHLRIILLPQKYIIKFLKEKKRLSDVHLTELNYQFIIDFERFLRNHQPTDHRKGLSNNGVMKHLERLRKMAGLAVKMEWMEKEPFNQYQLKFQRVDKTCWFFQHKVQEAMKSLGNNLLEGLVEVDGFFVGGPETGKTGRGNEKKQPRTYGVMAIEVDAFGIHHCYANVIPNAGSDELGAFLQAKVARDAVIKADKWTGYIPLQG